MAWVMQIMTLHKVQSIENTVRSWHNPPPVARSASQRSLIQNDERGVMKTAISRRQMLKLGGVTAAGALGASMIAACATSEPTEMADTSRSEGPGSFLIPPEPIVDFAETKEYDVVVVGAGEAGLSAVHTALEAGAKVTCVQNMACRIWSRPRRRAASMTRCN